MMSWLLVLSTMLYPPVPKKAGQPEDVWVGETVVARSTATITVEKDGVTRKTGLSHVTYRVIREDGDKIWLRQYDTEGWVLKAEMLRVAEAEAYLSALLKDNPQDTGAKNKRAVVRERRGDAAGALADYDDLIAENLNGSVYVYHNNRSTVLLGQNEYDLAVKELAKAFETNPNYAIALKNRANAYLGLRRFDAGLKDIDICIQQMPTYLAGVCVRGELQCAKGNYTEALADAELVLKSLPNDADALALRGAANLARGETEWAIADLDKALRLEPNSTSNRGLRGWAWLKINRPDKARYDFDEAVYANPKKPEPRSQRGDFFYRIGQFDEAKRDYEEALKIRPKHLPTCGSYSWMLATCPDAKFRDGKRAMELAQLACERTEFHHGPNLRSLAAANADLGKFDEARDLLKRAAEDKSFAADPENLLKECQAAFNAKQPYRTTPPK